MSTRLKKLEYQWRVRDVLGTPPIERGPVDAMVLSMLHPRDILQYLVAVKSFHRRVPVARHFLVADPTLGEEHVRLLRRHVPHLEVAPATSFRDTDLPVGGTWERLAAISRLREESFVVQLDADTLSRGPLTEVRDAIDTQRSFLISTEDGQAPRTLDQCVEDAAWRRERWDHVQLDCELALPKLAPLGIARYMRGCSGFSGFHRTAGSLEFIREVSRRMEPLVAPHWSKWGTEQFASNLLVCASDDPLALPHPKYGTPDVADADTVFIHFIGYMRFRDRSYVTESRRAIRDMAAGFSA